MTYGILPKSTFQAFTTRRDIIGQLNAEVNRASTELSTGRHADPYGALGSKAARAFNVGAELQRTESFLTSNKLLESQFDTTATVLQDLRTIAEEFLAFSVGSRDSEGATTSELQAAAKAAFTQIANLSNTTYAGKKLFSGVAADQPALTEWNRDGGAGLSPEDAMAAVLGGGLTTAADAAAKADTVDAMFASDPAAPAGLRFEEVFYYGADGTGPRVAAQIDADTRLSYGLQADDQGFRDLMQGLAMLAGTDASQIGDEGAYSEWVGRAVDKVSEGVGGVLDMEARLGFSQNRLELATERLSERRNVLTSERSELEGVDAYDAAMRLTELESRLQATYTVTARLGQLSFLNYL
ncbi:flagellin [Roseivivax sp.]